MKSELAQLHRKALARKKKVPERDVNPMDDLKVTLIAFVEDLMDDANVSSDDTARLARLRAYIDIRF